MCRLLVSRFLGCGHNGQPIKQQCGNINCQNLLQQDQVDPNYLCPGCERGQSPSVSLSSQTGSISSRLSTQGSTLQNTYRPRRLSLNPRENLRLQLEDLARQHSRPSYSSPMSADPRQSEITSNSHNDFPPAVANSTPPATRHDPHFTPTQTPVLRGPYQINKTSDTVHRKGQLPSDRQASFPVRVPVAYPPPPTPPNDVPVPYAPHARRRSGTRTATWIGSPPHCPLPGSLHPVNRPFLGQHSSQLVAISEPLQQPKVQSVCSSGPPITVSGPPQAAANASDTQNHGAEREQKAHVDRQPQSWAPSPHVAHGSFYHNPKIW